MKQCAIGIRVHSGWGAVVAVSGEANTLEVIDRRRVDIIDPKTPGAFQPYHFARALELPAAEKHIAKSAANSSGLATAALREAVDQLSDRGYSTVGVAILLGSWPSLPELKKILASHPMIHTAEGKFFRLCFAEACAALDITMYGIRDREFDDHAKAAFGDRVALVKKKIAALGKTLGPPWTTDQKAAALAAALVLEQSTRRKARLRKA